MEFNSRYSVTGEKPGITFDQPSQTLQSFKDDADINCIIARFQNTGVLVDPTVPVSRTPQFGDYSDLPTYQEAQNVIVAANNAFNALSAKIRERFGNDPAAYFDFVQSLKEGSEDYAEAIRLGIIDEPLDRNPQVSSRSVESSGEKVNS
ncbi:scaffolding protein [Chlamydia trachomatis]|nr:scaffolding protein [Chlamydia trachomatis]